MVLFAAIVLFQVVTLPVEFDASRRALGQITELGLVSSGEHRGARKVLTAAAMTYVAGALSAISLLAYYLLAFFGGRPLEAVDRNSACGSRIVTGDAGDRFLPARRSRGRPELGRVRRPRRRRPR